MNINTDRIELKIGDTTIVFRIEQILQKQETPKRPYDPEGRLCGKREIAEFTGLSESTISKMMAAGKLNVYHIGERKIVAYKDEIMEAISNISGGKVMQRALSNMASQL